MSYIESNTGYSLLVADAVELARLRRDDPVHWTPGGMYGAYWSVTKYRDIMAVDTDHRTFSSDAMMGGIVLRDVPMDFRRPSFISMDPPKHDRLKALFQRGFTPKRIAEHGEEIRQITRDVLDRLDGDGLHLGPGGFSGSSGGAAGSTWWKTMAPSTTSRTWRHFSRASSGKTYCR